MKLNLLAIFFICMLMSCSKTDEPDDKKANQETYMSLQQNQK